MTAASLLQEALKLPTQEREELCDKLRDSLLASVDEVLVQRLAAHQSSPENVISREALESKWQSKWGWKP